MRDEDSVALLLTLLLHLLQVAGHKFNVLLTHYDLVMRDKAFLRKIRWHYFIVDEGHRLKNHESVLATTIVNHYHIKRRILLTGEPFL